MSISSQNKSVESLGSYVIRERGWDLELDRAGPENVPHHNLAASLVLALAAHTQPSCISSRNPGFLVDTMGPIILPSSLYCKIIKGC